MKIRYLAFIFSLLAAGQSYANNCATCNGAAEGRICYATDDKVAYVCNGSAWTSLSNTRHNYTFDETGGPDVGANGGTTVTECTGAPGSTCGGGIYAGDGNLIATPSGCTDSATPTCAGGTDSVTKQWRNWDSSSYWAFSKSRYGYWGSENSTDTSYRAKEYCKNMTYGGYSDWYLPTEYEMRVLVANSHEIGGFNTSSQGYWIINEMRGDWGGSVNTTITAWPHTGHIWGLSDRTGSRYVRCVRRN